MRFQVPQFIEVEDKIFGPLTIKQFIYLGGGAGMAAVIYRLIPLPFFFKLLIAAPAVVLGLALAFYRVNNKPFVFVMQSALKYMAGPKLYIWKKVAPQKKTPKGEEEKEIAGLYVPKLSDSKLKDLTWSLDINENLNPGANESMVKGEK